MNLVRWDPFRIGGLRSEMDRLFDDFFVRRERSEDGTLLLLPQLDVSESPKTLTVNVELPGIAKDDVNVHVDNGILTISGKKEDKREVDGERCHISERRFGSFERLLSLPDYVDTEKTKASFKDGVLTIEVEKKAEVQPKEIQVEVK